MGKIFGISDNPVSTIDSALRPLVLEKKEQPVRIITKDLTDKFIPTEKVNKSNAFIKMRNGMGKLMSHLSNIKK